MAQGAHWIGSVAFEFRAREPKTVDSFRRAIRSDLDSMLLQPLQQALDRAETGRLVRHRRIEIDLGSLGPGALQDGRLGRRIATSLERQLGGGGAGVAGAWPPVADEGEQLAAFLATGVLGWPAPGEALATICAALLARSELDMKRLAARLRPRLARAPPAAERLVRQCPAALVRRIAAALGLLEAASPEPEAVRGFIREAEAPRWAAAILRIARGQPGAAKALGFPAKSLPEPATMEPDTFRRRDPGPPAEQRAASLPDDARAAEAPRAERAAEPVTKAPATDEEDLPAALPVEAAGAVLLHPFLSGLMGSAGLLDEQGGFAGSEAQARAVLLLHFVATGRDEAAEPDLALAKLLCGLDLTVIVPRRIDLTEPERAEAEAVLVAAIAHWDALGDVSAAALRETFLARPGRLQREGEDWRLIVEPRGVDVLLDRLPWAISLVKTRFMARPLRVDWR